MVSKLICSQASSLSTRKVIFIGIAVILALGIIASLVAIFRYHQGANFKSFFVKNKEIVAGVGGGIGFVLGIALYKLYNRRKTNDGSSTKGPAHAYIPSPKGGQSNSEEQPISSADQSSQQPAHRDALKRRSEVPQQPQSLLLQANDASSTKSSTHAHISPPKGEQSNSEEQPISSANRSSQQPAHIDALKRQSEEPKQPQPPPLQTNNVSGTKSPTQAHIPPPKVVRSDFQEQPISSADRSSKEPADVDDLKSQSEVPQQPQPPPLQTSNVLSTKSPTQADIPSSKAQQSDFQEQPVRPPADQSSKQTHVDGFKSQSALPPQPKTPSPQTQPILPDPIRAQAKKQAIAPQPIERDISWRGEAHQQLQAKLQPYFHFDSYGYITHARSQEDIQQLQQEVDTNLAQWQRFFSDVSREGDAGYAHEIRTAMMYAGVVSPQVDPEQQGAVIEDGSCQPVSIGRWKKSARDLQQAKTITYSMDAFSYAISQGYGAYKSTVPDSTAYTKAQLENYYRRAEITRCLDHEGELFARSCDKEEFTEVSAFQPNFYKKNKKVPYKHDIYSTTLLPKAGSSISTLLYLSNVLGQFLDRKRTHPANLGVSYPSNGFTDGQGFLLHKEKRDSQGSPAALNFEIQKQLFEEQAKRYNENPQSSYENLQPVLSKDRLSCTGFREGCNDIRQIKRKLGQVFLNETTFYRGAAHDLWVSNFVRGHGQFVAERMMQAIQIQWHMRCEYGLYLPIFFMANNTNEIVEIQISQQLLQSLNEMVPTDRLSSSITSMRDSTGKEIAGSFSFDQVIASYP